MSLISLLKRIFRAKIDVDICPLFDDVIIPKYETEGSAGCDVRAYFKEGERNDLIVKAGETKIVKTGITLAVTEDCVLDVRPRSGMSAKTKVRIANSPGTIDQDFRNEVGIIIDNIDGIKDEVIKHGDRIAQFVFLPVLRAKFNTKKTLNETNRKGGFGSTGKN